MMDFLNSVSLVYLNVFHASTKIVVFNVREIEVVAIVHAQINHMMME